MANSSIKGGAMPTMKREVYNMLTCCLQTDDQTLRPMSSKELFILLMLLFIVFIFQVYVFAFLEYNELDETVIDERKKEEEKRNRQGMLLQALGAF